MEWVSAKAYRFFSKDNTNNILSCGVYYIYRNKIHDNNATWGRWEIDGVKLL